MSDYIVIPSEKDGKKLERFIRIDTIAEALRYPETGELHIVQGDPKGQSTRHVLTGDAAADAYRRIWPAAARATVQK